MAVAPSRISERILLVDDEQDIRRTLARLLSDSGYVVETAATVRTRSRLSLSKDRSAGARFRDARDERARCGESSAWKISDLPSCS